MYLLNRLFHFLHIQHVVMKYVQPYQNVLLVLEQMLAALAAASPDHLDLAQSQTPFFVDEREMSE